MAHISYITHEGVEHVVEATSGESVMRIATSNGVPGIEAECGGVLSCATCHVYIDSPWKERLAPPAQAELDMLEFAEEPDARSRLSCQIPFRAELDGLVVRIPAAQ